MSVRSPAPPRPPRAKALRWRWACPACGWRSPLQGPDELEALVLGKATDWVEEGVAPEALEAEWEALIRRWPQVGQQALLQAWSAGQEPCGACGQMECRAQASPREAKRLRQAFRRALGHSSTVLAVLQALQEDWWRDPEGEDGA